MVRVCGPQDGLGEGLITERVDGETLGRRIAAAPEFETARRRLGAQAGAALAAIHAVEAPERLPIQRLSAAETLARYAEIYRETIPMRPVLEAAIRWLGERLPPEPDTPRLAHGDFRNGNLIVDPARGLTAVLDWELAHLGDPAEDIGWICVNSWRFGVTEREVGGFATLDDFLEGYAGAGGAVPPRETICFWQALGSFRWGVMTQMLGARGGQDPGTALERAVIATRLSECEVDLFAPMLPSPSRGEGPGAGVRAPDADGGSAETPRAPPPATPHDRRVRTPNPDPSPLEGEGSLARALAGWRASPDPARAPFLDRVADNAQAILDREAALRPASDEAAVARLSALLGESGDAGALTATLAQAIRDGRIPHDDPALLDHLRRSALDDLAIDQPRYRHALSEPGPTKPNR